MVYAIGEPALPMILTRGGNVVSEFAGTVFSLLAVHLSASAARRDLSLPRSLTRQNSYYSRSVLRRRTARRLQARNSLGRDSGRLRFNGRLPLRGGQTCAKVGNRCSPCK